MKNIVLIGMMGCGKSTVGELLAHRLGMTLVDTDALIERQSGCSVPELFATQGEESFRAMERGVAQALALRSDLVIACGGGLPLSAGAMDALRESGTVVWLNRDPGDIFDHEDLSDRPLAGDRAAFLARAAERAPIYRACAEHIVTDFTSPVSTAARIWEAVR